MALLAPALAFVAFWAVALRRPKASVGAAFLEACVVFGVTVLFLTEALSRVGALGPVGLALGWALVASGVTAAALRRDGWRTCRADARRVRVSLVGLWEEGRWLLLIPLAFYGALLILAVAAPPNTWDAMTYHLSRVMHWLQNGTADPYPTAIEAQLSQNPWGEQAVLHLVALGPGDRLAGVAQWLAGVASAVGVVCLTGELDDRPTGDRSRARTFALVGVATIPMGIMQATSTQVDLLGTVWLVCFAFFALRWVARPTLSSASLMGCALGLTILARAPNYLLAFPFCVGLFAAWTRRPGRRPFQHLVLAAGLLLVVNLPHYARNMAVYEHPLGWSTSKREGLVNEEISGRVVISNLIRNASLHVVIPQDEALAQLYVDGVHSVHDVLGLEANDPRTTHSSRAFEVAWEWSTFLHEDRTGSPLHLLLILVALGVLVRRRREVTPRTWRYLACLVLGVVSFCAAFRWQPWHCRLHLPLLVLAMPVVALALDRVRPRRAGPVVCCVLGVAALPFLLANKAKPVLGDDNVTAMPRTSQVFRHDPLLEEPYRAVCQRLRAEGHTQVGLVLTNESWEYPLWVLTRGEDALRLEHVNLGLESPSVVFSGLPPFVDFQPTALIVIGEESRLRVDPRGWFVIEPPQSSRIREPVWLYVKR